MMITACTICAAYQLQRKVPGSGPLPKPVERGEALQPVRCCNHAKNCSLHVGSQLVKIVVSMISKGYSAPYHAAI